MTRALLVSEWALRWAIPEEDALRLLESMAPGTVQELPGGRWRLLDAFTRQQGAAGLGTIELPDGIDRRPDAPPHHAYSGTTLKARQAASRKAGQLGKLAEPRATRLSPHRDQRASSFREAPLPAGPEPTRKAGRFTISPGSEGAARRAARRRTPGAS